MTNWNVNSEYQYRKGLDTAEKKHSAVIYLVLDSSKSLTPDNVTAIKTAAKKFIELVSGEEGAITE
jgi:hypothetical protein